VVLSWICYSNFKTIARIAGYPIMACGSGCARRASPAIKPLLIAKAALYAQRPAMKIAAMTVESKWITD
jgi:hypothetical protein